MTSPASESGRSRPLAAVLAVGLACGIFATAPAARAEPSPEEVVNAFEAVLGPIRTHRPSHAKGICAAGHFVATPEGTRLSVAPTFSGQRIAATIRFGIGGRLQQFIHCPAAGDVLVAKTPGLKTGLIDVVIGQEIQFGPPKTCRCQSLCLCQGDKAGIGTGERNGCAGACLGKAGAVAGIEGESGTAAVGQTGALTGVEGRIED
jgi:hypothetical protein